MNNFNTVMIEEINEYKSNTINPLKYPDELFEMYSVPSFDDRFPEIVKGKDIGSTKQVVEKGDVLICKINPRINRIWVVSSHTKYIKIASSEWIVVRNKDINPNYLACYFRSNKFKQLMTAQITGMGGSLMRAQPKNVKSYTVPIPNKHLQDIIVETLDKAQSLIDKRKQQIEACDELIKSRFVGLFGEPGDNPNNWPFITVKEAIEKGIIDKPLDGNHGGKHPKVSDYVSEGIPFLMANNLIDGKVDLEHCAFITEEQANSLDKGFAKDGDVLITHKGTIGRTAILSCKYPYVMLTPQITYYRPKKDVTAQYLKGFFDTNYFQNTMMNIAGIGSTRAYIGITAQQDLFLMIPPAELQIEYVNFVKQVDKLKSTLQQSLTELENNFNALMQKAFNGELFK